MLIMFIIIAIIGKKPPNTSYLVRDNKEVILLFSYNRYNHYNSETQSSVATLGGCRRRCGGAAVACCTQRVLAVVPSQSSSQVVMFWLNKITIWTDFFYLFWNRLNRLDLYSFPSLQRSLLLISIFKVLKLKSYLNKSLGCLLYLIQSISVKH